MHSSAVCLPHPNLLPREVITGSWCDDQQKKMRVSRFRDTVPGLVGCWAGWSCRTFRNSQQLSQPPPPQKNCTQYPYSPRIIVEGDHPDKRLHWSRSKSLPICTHAQFRLICVSCVKLLRMRAETERLPLQNNSDDWKYKISNILD